MTATTPIGPADVFPRLSTAALWRASVRALLYFTVLLPCGFLPVNALVASGTGNDVPTLLALLPVMAFVAGVIGAIPTVIGFLIATVLQRTLDHTPRRGVHRLTAGSLAGVIALGVTALFGRQVLGPYPVVSALIVVASASTAAVAAWEVTRRHLDRDIARYGVHHPSPEGAP